MSNQFYKSIAPYYDKLYPSVESDDDIIEFIQWAFGELSSLDVKNVLDCGCGTGRQTISLLRAGYNVTASDFSPDMLEIAKAKFKQDGFKVPVEVNDIRSLAFDNDYDAIVFIFSAFNHMLTSDDVKNALNSMKRALLPGGIIIFDIINIIHFLDNFLKDNTEHYRVDDHDILRHIRHRIDSVNSTMEHDEITFISDGKTTRTFSDKVDLRIFTKPELDYLINEVGFKKVNFFRGFDDRGEKEGNSSRIVYVCQKYT
ncbi:MAG: class I SAM-dependent methyltransferase [candidate division Zixibacteria bacterium]|nr:class I SAM-dependent methyltransferase [candidate division Zixibacteria bacterium]